MHSPAGLKRRVLSLCVLAWAVSTVLVPRLHADPAPLIWRLDYTITGSNGQSVTRSFLGPGFAWGDSLSFGAPQLIELSTTGTCGNGRVDGRVVAHSYNAGCAPCPPLELCPPCTGQATFTGTCEAYVPLATSVYLYPGAYTGTGTVYACTSRSSAYARWNNISMGNACTDPPRSIDEHLPFGARNLSQTIDYNGTTYVRIGHIPLGAEISYSTVWALSPDNIHTDVDANFVITVDVATLATKGTWGRLKAIYR